MDSYLPGKGTKPIPGGANEDEYRRVMNKIMQGLTKENLDTILFLCKDHIPHGREITTTLHFLKFLEDRDHVSPDSVVFIAEILHIIRRMDLLKVIPCIQNKNHFEAEYLSFSYTSFSNYRVLTVQLQDELSHLDFETFRSHSRQHLKPGTLDSATNVLSLIRKMEEEDIISNDNYDELLSILECIENVKPLKMFQRLLGGDQSVAVPASKQKQARDMLHETGFASRRNVPNSPERSAWTDKNIRVEPQQGYLPPAYSAHPRIGPYDTSDHQTEAKYHNEKNTFMYDLSGNNAPEFVPFSSKWFPSEESTPKSVVGTEPMPGPGPGLIYIQQQNSHPQGNNSHHRRFESLPGFHGMPSYGEQQYYSLPHPESYPRNLGNQGHFQTQRREFGYPVQQQISSDATKSPSSPGRQDPYPVVFSGMPPHLQSPEGENVIAGAGDKMQSLSMNDEMGASGGFVEENTPAAKASSSLEMISDKPESGESSPEHKEFQKYKDLYHKQRNDSYRMDGSPVGICILINNVNFVENRLIEERERRIESNKNPSNRRLELPRIELGDRVGSNEDANKLEKLFKCFDFEVQRHDDLNQHGINKVIYEAGQLDHDAYDCFLVIVLSHGDTGCVFGVDGFPVKIIDIQKKFFAENCPSLANKPKLFFIQACQGNKEMPFLAPVSDTVDSDGPGNLDVDESTPSRADFLIANSTVPGHKSYRSKMRGTHFIQEIIHIFKMHYEHEDLLGMMIKVNKEVAKYEQKQIPMPVATLTKKVFFHLKEGCELPVDDENKMNLNQANNSSGGDKTSMAKRAGVVTQETGDQNEN